MWQVKYQKQSQKIESLLKLEIRVEPKKKLILKVGVWLWRYTPFLNIEFIYKPL